MKKKRHRLLLFSLLLMLSTACRPERKLAILTPPATPSLTAGNPWGMVNKPYLKVLNSQQDSAKVDRLLRYGDIVEILAKVGRNQGRQYWLQIRGDSFEGWVTEDSLDIYDSSAQARTASLNQGP